jgi:hypothetical protein
MLGRARDLLGADIRPDHVVEELGEVDRRLTGAGAAIPREPPARRDRGQKFEQRARISRSER